MMHQGHYINPAQLAAEREAEEAMKAAELARVRDMFEVRTDETILRLKRERVDGTEARSLERLRIAEEGAARRREATEAMEQERMKHVGPRAQQFKVRKAATLAQNRVLPAS